MKKVLIVLFVLIFFSGCNDSVSVEKDIEKDKEALELTKIVEGEISNEIMAVAKLLQSQNIEDQRNGFDKLKTVKPKSVADINYVIDLIEDETQTKTVQEIVRILSNIDNQVLIPKIIEVIENNNNQRIKVSLITSLARLKNKRAIPVLIKCLDENEYIVVTASNALAEIGDESVIPEMIKRIENDGNASSIVGLPKFGLIALEKIIEELEKNNNSKGKRFRLIQVIGFIKDPKAIPKLRELLQDKNDEIVVSAIQSLSNMNALNYSDVEKLLQYKDAIIRISTVSASEEIKDDRINAILINTFLNDKSSEVRSMTATVLANRNAMDAVPHFEKALNDKSKLIQGVARRSLKKITGKEYEIPQR